MDSASFLPPGVFLQRTVAACPCAFCSAGIKTALLGAAVDQADFAVNILPPTEDPIEIRRVFLQQANTKWGSASRVALGPGN